MKSYSLLKSPEVQIIVGIVQFVPHKDTKFTVNSNNILLRARQCPNVWCIAVKLLQLLSCSEFCRE